MRAINAVDPLDYFAPVIIMQSIVICVPVCLSVCLFVFRLLIS